MMGVRRYSMLIGLTLFFLTPLFADNKDVWFYSLYDDTHIAKLDYIYDPHGLDVQTVEIEVVFVAQHKVRVAQKIVLQKGAHSLYWYSSQMSTIQRVRLITKAGSVGDDFKFQFSLHSYVIPTATGYGVPYASLEDMFEWNKDSQKYHDDFFLFRWYAYPDVVVFSFKSREVQARYLKRLAFFTEKTFTRGTVSHLEDIAHRKGWGAHDYKIEDIVDFFNEVARYNRHNEEVLVLTTEEKLLAQLLIDLDMMTKKERSYGEETSYEYRINNAVPHAAIVSYTRSDSRQLQGALLFHELFHTFYFRDEQVRNTVHAAWRSLIPLYQEIWKSFLERNGYDASFSYLTQNELFAYLLQRPISVLSWYIPARIISESSIQRSLSTREVQGFVDTLTILAEALSQYMDKTYMIEDGEVRYVRNIY